VPKTPEELAAHRCVTFSAVAADTSWGFAARGRRTKVVTPRRRLDINTAEAAVDAAVAGLGVTRVLSYQAAQAVAEKKLKIVLQEFEPPPVPVHLLHAAARDLLPLKMQRFLEFAAPRIRKSLAAAQRRLG
jgi:DNA-binding transcriptional LysR family regulator